MNLNVSTWVLFHSIHYKILFLMVYNSLKVDSQSFSQFEKEYEKAHAHTHTIFSRRECVCVKVYSHASHFMSVRFDLCLIFKYIEWVFQWHLQNYNKIIITIIKDELKLCKLNLFFLAAYWRVLYPLRPLSVSMYVCRYA